MPDSNAQAAGINAQPKGLALFVAKGLAKTYQMGEVKVTALVDVDLTVNKGGVHPVARTVGQLQVDFAE